MRNLIFCMTIAFIALFMFGCKKGESESTVPSSPVVETPKGPDYRRFAALKKVSFDVSLPFFVDSNANNDTACFVEAKDIVPTSADDRVQGYVEKNNKEVTATIMDWFLYDLHPDLVTSTVTANWTVAFDDLVSLELDADALRYAEDPQCFTNQGWLPDDRHLITTVYGTRKIKFASSVPLTENIKKAIKSAAAAKNIEMTTGMLGDDPQNPTPVTEWELTFENPIYFGAREIPNRMWRKESNKYDCELIFVTGGKSTLKPECVEYQESRFSLSVEKGGAKPVSVLVNTSGKKKRVELSWGEVVKVRVNDRIYLWLKADQVEVGSRLRINSVVLNPVPLPGQEYEDEDAYEMVIEEDPGDGEEEKEQGAYTPSSDSGNPVDGYLSN